MPLIILLVALAAAWSAALGATPAAAQTAPTYRSVVAPFPVTDSAGRLLELAFLGGFNAPRPQLVDADGDGDLDLFVQENRGEIGYYERDGVTKEGLPRFLFKTAKYGGIDAGEWYRFADVDNDGDLDLLTEQPFSYIRYYRNDGERGAQKFVLAADTLRDSSRTPLFADAQNIPQLGDLDCNKRADLLLGRVDGTVSRYEAVAASGSSKGSVPTFQLVTDEFEGIRIVGEGQIGPGDPRSAGPSAPFLHGANTMALADHDADGDLDLFWGDFFEPGLLLIANTGSCQAPNFRNEPVRFPPSDPFSTSGYNAPAFGDVNGDKRLDVMIGVIGGAYNPLVTSVENLFYIERTATGDWSLRTRQLLPVLDIGSESVPTVVDLDSDGDLDLLLSNKIDPADLTTSKVFWFENQGSKTKPAFRLRGALPLTGRDQFHVAPAFTDLNGDGALDVVVGGWKDRVSWYRRTNDRFELIDSALVTLTRGSNTMPALGDLDGDGDLDMLVGEASGWLNYYRNDGSKTKPRFALVSDEYAEIKANRRSAPHLVDFDGDGDLDLLLGTESDGLLLYRNKGSRTAPRFERDKTFKAPVLAIAAPATGDFDGDGDLDLIVGGSGGGLTYLERQ